MPESTINKLFALKERNNQMPDEPKKKGVPVVLKEFFGLKKDQDLRGFLAELKELSMEEKEQLAEGINNGTYTY